MHKKKAPQPPPAGWRQGDRDSVHPPIIEVAGAGPGDLAADRANDRSDNQAADRIDEFRDATRGSRIQKVLAEAGVGSRRACESLVADGLVSVNGHVIRDLPIWVDPQRDQISVRGKPLIRPSQFVYVMLCKPRNCVCTNDDSEGRRRAIDLVRHPSRVRLFPVGRLDMDSTGLLLLTNDGELANRLTHPRHGVHKTYEVTVAGSLTDRELEKLQRGLFLTETRHRSKPARASRTHGSSIRLLKRDREQTRLIVELREGRNRQIRRMMARLGHPVNRLRRVQMGPLKLRGLRSAQWRDLMPQEVATLKRAAYGKPSSASHGQRTAPGAHASSHRSSEVAAESTGDALGGSTGDDAGGSTGGSTGGVW